MVVVIAVLLVVLLLSTAIVASSIQSNTTSVQDTAQATALADANAGLNAAVARLSQQAYDGSGDSTTILNQCFTTTFTSQDSSGNCTGQTGSMGSLGSYTYYISPEMGSSTYCSTSGTTSTPCWTNHTTSSCTGYPVQGSGGLDVSQRCVTSIGTYDGTVERVQERLVNYEFTFPVAGMLSLTNMLFDTNQPTEPYDGCPSAKHPPCPPVYLNGNFEANGKITIGGSAYSNEDVVNGTLDRGPSGTISLTDSTYNCPASGSSASTLAYPGVTVTCSEPSPTTSNYPWAAGATEADYTSSATTNNDTAINTANPSHTGTSAPYQSSTRTFSVSNSNSSASSPIIIPSGIYNFCSFTVNNGYVQINSGSHVTIYVDNSTTGDGCATGSVNGQIDMPTAGFINNNSNPNTLQFLVCGDVSGESGPCGQWSGVGPCTGPACTAASTIDVTSNGGTSWSNDGSSQTVTLAGDSCASATVCAAVGASGTIATTTNGGSNWVTQTSGSTVQLNGISCPSTTTCFAVGAAASGPSGVGTILATTNGGTTWTSQSSGDTGNAFESISCPSTTTCFAVDAKGGVRVTTNGGTTWTSQTSGDTNQFNGISCPSTTTCYAVDNKGGIKATTNGGTTWTSQTSGDTNAFDDISCPSTTTCFAVDAKGGIKATTNGGTTWSSETSGTTQQLNGISCPSTTICFADGASGTMIGTSNGGSTWTTQTSGVTAALDGMACGSTSVCVGVGATTTPSSQSIGLVTLNDDSNTTGGPSGNGMTYGEVYAPDSALTTTGYGLRWTGGIVVGSWESNDNDYLQAAPGYGVSNPTLDFYPVAFHVCSTTSSSTTDPTLGCY
jgi:hypothetical protein